MTTLAWLPDAAWRGAVLLAIAFVVARLLRSQPAAVRHVLWAAALAGVMVMPLLSVVAPLRLPITLPVGLPGVAATPTFSQSAPKQPRDEGTVKDRAQAVRLSDGTPGITLGRPATNDVNRVRAMSPVTGLFAVWLAGAILLSLRLVAGFVALGRMRRAGVPADAVASGLAGACAARLGLHATPRLIASSRVAMPCTAGWLRPIVLLPDEYTSWSRERLEVVLLHELSHVRRLDIVPHLLSEVTRVVYWFNPLVWLAAARLRAEAERATDDRVVHAGARPSDYAAHLLEIVRQARPTWHPAPLMPLARRSEFEGRMLAILETGGAMPRARWALGTLALVTGLSFGVASLEGAPAHHVAGGEKDAAGVLPGESRAPDTRAPEPSPRPRRTQAVESAASALVGALRDPVASVRQAAAEALGGSRDSVAVRALMDVLRSDESAMVRRSAAWALGQISDPVAIPALSEALTRDRDTEVRKNAASALGEIDSPRATPALMQALERDTEASVRVMAAEALSNIEDPAAIDALIRVLDRDDEPDVRRAVIEAIDNLDGARAVPAVSRALRDANPEVRRAAAEALGSMEDNDAVPALLAVARDADAEVRRAVIHSLGSLGDRRAIQAFVGGLSDSDVEVRRAAADGFGNLDNVRTAPAELLRAMDDRDAEVRHAAAHALGHIEDPDAVRVLVAHVSDPNVEVRQAVVESLDQFDDPAVVPALRIALKDVDADVRERAVKALGNRNRSR